MSERRGDQQVAVLATKIENGLLANLLPGRGRSMRPNLCSGRESRNGLSDYNSPRHSRGNP